MIIAQISDPHISQVGGKADRKYETAAHLQRAVAHLTRLPAPPDVVLITGSCTSSMRVNTRGLPGDRHKDKKV